MSSSKSFGVIIIGGGIAGLISAAKLAKSGLKVLLLEKETELGGRLISETFTDARFTHGYRFFQKTENITNLINDLGLVIEVDSSDSVAKLYDHNKKILKDWPESTGFEYPERYFTNQNKFMPSGGFTPIIQKLTEIILENNGKIKKLDSVTNIEIDEFNFVKSVKTARGEEFSSDFFVFASHPASIIPLCDKSVLSSKFIKKMTRTRPHPALVLEHKLSKKFTDEKGVVFIPMSSKDEKGYLFGGFTSNWIKGLCTDEKQIGSWILPLTEDQYADNHEVSLIIKNCRRLLNKVFEGYVDAIEFEKVSAIQSAFPSMDEKIQELPEFQNLKFIGDSSDYETESVWLDKSIESAIKVSDEIAKAMQ